LQAEAAQYPALTALAASLKLKNELKFLGSIGPEEILEEILSCNVGLIARPTTAYHQLTLPQQLYDYIRLERPVIASRLDAIAAYYPDSCLVYYEPGKENDLADQISWVFAHPEDLGRRVRAAAENVEAYRWIREQKKYIGIYQNLTTGGSRRS
jgi:glycosyltransferase involved in cell wall biosynthesis